MLARLPLSWQSSYAVQDQTSEDFSANKAGYVRLVTGSSQIAAAELTRDFELLDRAESGDNAVARAWTCVETAVVLGVSLDAEREVDLDACAQAGVAVLRRASGGGAVVIGPGTLQYAISLRYDLATDLLSIPGSKRLCNRLTVAALRAAGFAGPLGDDESGDLRCGDRKVAGVALKRKRHAMMLHGTILMQADLDRIGELLRHPAREPVYRAGRRHRDFLANLGDIDTNRFGNALTEQVARLIDSAREGQG